MNAGNVLMLIIGITAIVVMAGVLFDHAPSGDDGKTDVVFLMGQSNAGYNVNTADPAEAEPVPEPGTAYFYGTHIRPARLADDPAGMAIWPMSDDSGAIIGDKWPSLASAYVEADGRHVVMAQLSQVGQSITMFSPEDGPLWEASVARAGDVLQAMADANMTVGTVSVVWIQGENDRTMQASEYEARLLQIGTAIKNGGLGCEVPGPVWISLINGSGGSVEAQKAIVQDHPGMFRMASELAATFTVDNGLMSSDGIHYTQEGNNLLGAQIGEAVGHEAKQADKMTTAIWGVIGIGIIAIIAFGCAQFVINRN